MKRSIVLSLVFTLSIWSAPIVEIGRIPCLLPFWGGLLAGQSQDRAVIKLFGNGLLVEKPSSHSRIYSNTDSTIFLIIRIAGDQLVSEIEVTKQVDFEKELAPIQNTRLIPKVNEFPPVIGAYFLTKARFGISEKDLMNILGSTRVEITNSKTKETLLEYHSQCSCDLPLGISFKFRAGQLVSYIYWAALG